MHIICHYNEIGIKGGNRSFFEKTLVSNIKALLDREAPGSFEYVRRIYGRILVKLSKDGTKKQKTVEKTLSNIFGIANFSFAQKSKQDMDILKKDCWNLIKNEFSAKGGSASGGKTFRITTQRSNKNFPLTSQQVNEKIGEYIGKKSKKKVSLKNPETNCYIEIVDNDAFVYLEKIAGLNGMPVGTSGKVLVLLSGGIDSPVASYFAMKRGAHADFIHFHSAPYTSQASIEKVRELKKIVDKYQDTSKIFMIPFGDIQKEIMTNVPPKLRVIFYRRVMMIISQELAEKEKCLALITGEAIGQVASQTLENIRATEDAVTIPILRPLIGFDKEEIVTVAKKIGTYETSILPHDDCCTRFVPKHPETRAKMEEVKNAEKNLNVGKFVKIALEKMETT